MLLWASALLYGGLSTRASEALGAELPGADPLSEHVALLLPTGSDAFSKAAAAVHAGFLEAARKQTAAALSVRLYAVTDDPQHVITAYQQAVAAGARLIVGPLTRNGVTALAGSNVAITVPTLALNVPEGLAAYPANLYTLSLHIEAEARQVAQLALREGRRNMLTITEPTALGRRMRDAFVDQFQSGGGSHIADHALATDSAGLERIRQAARAGNADTVFLAADAARARLVRPHVSDLQGYGTSQLNPGLNAAAGFIDLSDVYFVDMPWMVQPDHAAVMTYRRDAPRGSDDLERLHALGIDAFRVAQALLAGKLDFEIDGVTGRLTLGSDGHVKRGLLIALITGGHLTVLGETRP